MRHTWTFDAAFSAWSVQGIDTDRDGTVSPEELQVRADDNMAGLAQFEYYTYAFEEDHALTFGSDLPATYASANRTVERLGEFSTDVSTHSPRARSVVRTPRLIQTVHLGQTCPENEVDNRAQQYYAPI